MANVPLEQIVFLYEMNALVETERDDEAAWLNPECPVGAFRLIDLALSSGCAPEVFRNRLLEQPPIPILKMAAAQTEPIRIVDELDYREGVAALMEEMRRSGLVAYGTDEVHRAFTEADRARRARLAAEQPDLVLSIEFEGSVCRNVYDDHPGLAYFDAPQSRKIAIPEPLPLKYAMDFAVAEWNRNHGDRDNSESDADARGRDGKFTPSKIVLFNAVDAVVQEFDGSRWVTELAPESEWSKMIERADVLDSDGSRESGWDNFATAERYHRQATSLRRQVSIARAKLAASRAPGVPPDAGLTGHVEISGGLCI
ncbi:hypothetical protein [Burkholderia gladioli]|uniref:hypothetical protein n=1 Tax=Burkholderia gladioli TaxID=28095 RepID=UPI0016401AE9|nr:hypothetical protein [Burkholderia gladioli]